MAENDEQPISKQKGPLSYLSGSLTAALLFWLALTLSLKIVKYYSLHPPSYNSIIAQNIAITIKTLMVGMSFIATFSTGFVAIGLALVFLRSLFTRDS